MKKQHTIEMYGTTYIVEREMGNVEFTPVGDSEPTLYLSLEDLEDEAESKAAVWMRGSDGPEIDYVDSDVKSEYVDDNWLEFAEANKLKAIPA